MRPLSASPNLQSSKRSNFSNRKLLLAVVPASCLSLLPTVCSSLSILENSFSNSSLLDDQVEDTSKGQLNAALFGCCRRQKKKEVAAEVLTLNENEADNHQLLNNRPFSPKDTEIFTCGTSTKYYVDASLHSRFSVSAKPKLARWRKLFLRQKKRTFEFTLPESFQLCKVVPVEKNSIVETSEWPEVAVRISSLVKRRRMEEAGDALQRFLTHKLREQVTVAVEGNQVLCELKPTEESALPCSVSIAYTIQLLRFPTGRIGWHAMLTSITPSPNRKELVGCKVIHRYDAPSTAS